MRTTVERFWSAGSERRYSSTARISVVLPEPDEPTRRMLPTRRPATFFASATDISRTASSWPITRASIWRAISVGDGVEVDNGANCTEPRRTRSAPLSKPAPGLIQ